MGDSTTLNRFKDILKAKLSEYTSENILNCDETGLMYKLSAKKTYTFSKCDRANGKFSKERITILFAVNRAGELLKPLIVNKYENPGCFKGVDIIKLPAN